MEVSYGSKPIRRLCRNKNSARKKLGEDNSLFLFARLADIDAAKNADELQLLPRLFSLNDYDALIIAVKANETILQAKPVSYSNAEGKPSNNIDWKQVIRLKIICVEGIK